MKVLPVKKRWIKVILIPVSVLLFAAGFIYYTVAYRLKDALQAIVKKESKGAYVFDADNIQVSFTGRNIVINNAKLICKDTLHTTSHYDVKIPDVYLSIQSWKGLLMGKLSIDSLSIALPELKIHDHTVHQNKHIAFNVSGIFNTLQKLIEHLEIRTFTLHDASFTYGNIHNKSPFLSNRINFGVKNFSRQKKSEKKFFSSDDVDLSITNQHWKLPDGVHEIYFSKLHFSGSSQFFEIDSCVFKGTDKSDNNFSISAERLFFNSKQLADFYNKDELILDTLILFRPVINLETVNKEKAKDTTQLISQSFRHLFKIINFKYIDVKEGLVQLKQKSSSQPLYTSQTNDLRIYNFLLNEDSSHATTDSIALKEKNISFITKDSLFKLTIEEFTIDNNTVLLKNAVYKPTELNKNTKVFTFKTPLLKLYNTNLEDLLTKKLTATGAELHEPEITVSEIKKTVTGKKAPASKVKRTSPDMDRFYTILHDMSELINVQEFRIIKGNLSYRTSGAEAVTARMENINSLILLDRFFSSDSLIDIKRSLQRVDIGRIVMASPKVKLDIQNFTFEGFVRHNRAETFQLTLGNGTSIKGKDLSWVIFDWDMYQNHKIIQVNTINIGEVSIAVKKTGTEPGRHITKDLPVMQVNRIDIQNINFTQSDKTGNLHFNGENICLDEIHSMKNIMLWTNAEGLFNNISFTKPGIKAEVNKVVFNTQDRTVIHNTKLEMNSGKNTIHFSIPMAKTDFQFHSSDFSGLHLNSLLLDHPVGEVIQKGKDQNKSNNTGSGKASSFVIDDFSLNSGKIKYEIEDRADSLYIASDMSIKIADLQYNKNATDLVTYKKAVFGFSDLRFNKKNTAASVPDLTINAGNGSIRNKGTGTAISTALLMQWKDAALQLSKTDSTKLIIEKLSGSFSDNNFLFEPKSKLQWKTLLNTTIISNGNINYKGKTVTAEINTLKWNSQRENLSTGFFKIIPNKDAGTYFKDKGWQTDYITTQGNGIDINGIRFGRHKGDSTLAASSVVVEKLLLTTLRDKKIPFKHGIEKPMLSSLTGAIKYPLYIDTVQLKQAKIIVNEITEKTRKQAVIPLEDINVLVTNVSNRNNEKDSIFLNASLKLYNNYIHNFSYAEAYGDSLFSFRLRLKGSPMVLKEFSAITVPLANVSIDGGNAYTVSAEWYGNKYAAAGTMNLYYDGLKIKLLNKKDSTKSGFLQRIEAYLANNVALHRKNSEPAFIFFVRDRERSVFNYWVKTKLNGVLSSAAILQNKKHRKQFLKEKAKYMLPDTEIQ